MLIALSRIKSSARPIRNEKDEEKLQQLADSMKEQGRVIVPIKVRSVNGEEFEVVYGNRRLEAARRLQWNEIDCILEDTTDDDALVQEMIENLIREDMSPIDTAKGLKRLIDETGWSMREIERRGIMSNGNVSKLVGLLNLPEDVQALISNTSTDGRVEEGKISPYHVEAVGASARSSEILKKAADEHLTADQTKQIVRNVSVMGDVEAEAYLARPGVVTSKEEFYSEEKEKNPDVLEYIELMKQYFNATNALANAIRDEEIEVTEKAAFYIYRQTGLMYGIWDNLRKVIKHSQPKEITE